MHANVLETAPKSSAALNTLTADLISESPDWLKGVGKFNRT